MTPEDSSVDEAQADQAAGSATEADASSEETPTQRYRLALDLYLRGTLKSALDIVESILEAEPDDDLRPRLERLRRRTLDRSAAAPVLHRPCRSVTRHRTGVRFRSV